MECGGTIEKMVSQSSFQLKGKGWYATDYAKKTEQPSSSSACAKSDKPCKAASA